MSNITTVREAVRIGATDIVCNNHTYVVLLNQQDYCPPKIINGKPVYRKLHCRINPPYNGKTKCHMPLDNLPGMADLKAKGYWLGECNYSEYFEFIIKERDLNHFISLNGGIDEYATMYWVDVKNDWWGELEEKDDEIWSNCNEDW